MRRGSFAWKFAASFAPFVLFAAQARAQMTERESIDSSGTQGNGISILPAPSLDGRYVAFQSAASNLVAADANAVRDVFVRDRLALSTERVSVSTGGVEGNAESTAPSISADGRYVAFQSNANNLVSGDGNARTDIFVRDRQSGTTERVSVDSAGVEGNSDSTKPSLSADGRYVAFVSYASNLVSGDTNGWGDIFVRDRQAGTTTRVSVDSAGAQVNGGSDTPSISGDGRYVGFQSLATNLVAGDGNGVADVFVHDRQTGATERVSVDSSGTEGNAKSVNTALALSADGRYVAFTSDATNLVSSDSNAASDVFVRDRQAATTKRVSVDSSGVQGNNTSNDASISADGKRVAFDSFATQLVAGDTNNAWDVFLRDLTAGTTTRMSLSVSGVQGNSDSLLSAVAGDGRCVALSSLSTNFVNLDSNGTYDVFVRGPFLTLEFSPASPPAGATITLSTFNGSPFAPAMLVVVGLNGTPLFLPVYIGSFDARGVLQLGGTVPGGLSGVVVSFETFGIVPTGKAESSNLAAVTFQ